MRRVFFAVVAAVLVGGCTGGVQSKDGGDDTGLPGELLGIYVTPEDVVLNVGGEGQLRATGMFADRTTLEVTHLVNWHSSKRAFVEVSNRFDEEGTINGVAVGQSVVTASLQGITSVPTNVRVTDAELLSITVRPETLVVELGETIQLEAETAWSDGSRGNAAAQARWITDDGSVAQIEAGGRLTAAGVGATTIHADFEGLSSEDVAVEVVSGAQPDLVISNFTVEGGESDFTATATVKNRGSAGASSFWVDLFVDPQNNPQVGDLGDTFGFVSYVGPEETDTVTFTREASEGSHTVWAIVDTDGFVEESDTTNNSASGTVNVGAGAGGKANLQVSYFSSFDFDGTIYYWVDVYNAGGVDASGFYVDVFYDRTTAPAINENGDQFERVESLAAGDTAYVEFEVEQDCYYCWSWVTLDSLTEIDESNEDDNIEGPLTVTTGEDGGSP